MTKVKESVEKKEKIETYYENEYDGYFNRKVELNGTPMEVVSHLMSMLDIAIDELMGYSNSVSTLNEVFRRFRDDLGLDCTDERI